MEIAYFALVSGGFILGVLVTWLAARSRRAFVELEKRVGDLEKSAAKRHTHRTIAGLEDATALVIDLKIEAETMEARLETLRRVLGKTREGPEAYENCEWDAREIITAETQRSDEKSRMEGSKKR